MTDDEFRALVAQGPATVIVSKADMLQLLDERDAAVRRAEAAKRDQRMSVAALAPLDAVVALLGIADYDIEPAAAVQHIMIERDAARADAARMREALTFAAPFVRAALAKALSNAPHRADDYRRWASDPAWVQLKAGADKIKAALAAAGGEARGVG